MSTKKIASNSLKLIALSVMLFLALVFLGNNPIVQKVRGKLKAEVRQAKNLGDQQIGLNRGQHQDYLEALAKKFVAGVPFLPEFVTVPSGILYKGCIGPACKQEKGVPIDSFAIASTELTVEQWDICVAMGGCDHMPSNFDWGRGDLPVVNVSWEDTQDYIQWLNSVTDGGYRLPTDSEWEYAAKANMDTRFAWGNANPDCSQIRHGSPNWTPKIEHKCQEVKTWPVRSALPNPWGLYNVVGNAAEWTSSCNVNPDYGTTTSTRLIIEEFPRDGGVSKRYPSLCLGRTHRGGNWCSWEKLDVLQVRSYAQDYRYNRVGFRLVRDKRV